MKKIITAARIALIFILFALACQKEETFDPPSPPEPPGVVDDKKVSANFTGKITDHQGNPLAAVLVKGGNSTALTDINGIFSLPAISVSEDFAFITAEKTGYFIGSRTVLSSENASHYVEIQLNKRDLKGTINSSGTASIELTAGTNVVFNSNSFVTASGLPYSGTINVYGHYLNPESETFTLNMPGDLRGIREDNSITALKSYGMIEVELESENGEKLQMAQGSRVKLISEIPSSLQATAPQKIPMWYFDINDGKWKEEGSATRSGNIYTGEVSHFTTWNYDVPLNFSYVSLKLIDENNNPFVFSRVSISDNRGASASGNTDTSGFLKLWVPKGTPLMLSVQNECGETIHQQNIDPLFEDTQLGDIPVLAGEKSTLVINGTAIGCDLQPVVDGIAIITFKGLRYNSPIIDGKFEAEINRCENSSAIATIYTINHTGNQESEKREIIVTTGQHNAGEFQTCGESSSEFLTFELANNTYHLTIPPDSAWMFPGTFPQVNVFEFKKAPFDLQSPFFQFTLTDTVPHFEYQYCQVRVNGQTWRGDRVKFDVAAYGKVNEFIELDFNGDLTRDSSITTLRFVGSLRVRRRI